MTACCWTRMNNVAAAAIDLWGVGLVAGLERRQDRLRAVHDARRESHGTDPATALLAIEWDSPPIGG